MKKKNVAEKKKKKCYPNSFPILGERDSIRALQSSPFQKYENLKKSQKITIFLYIFFLIFFLPKKKKKKKKKKNYPLSFSILGGRDSTRALQSSPSQKYDNLKNSLFSFLVFRRKKKRKNAILLVFHY